MCFRYFGFQRFEDVDNLTIRQINIMVDALKLRNVDTDFRQHWQAFLNLAVKGTKGKGKNIRPVYNTFNKFFDYREEVNKALGVEEPSDNRFAGLARYLHEKQEDK